MTVSEELAHLAATLADWTIPAPNAAVYLFGSRVRGDHRQDSDVDIVVRFPKADHADLDWWTANNHEYFAGINARLPGPLRILENNDPVSQKVLDAAVTPVYRDRSVICVYMPPKAVSSSP